MKKLISFFILFLSFSSAYAEKPKFIFAYGERELFPNFMGNGDEVPKKNPGIDIEFLRLIEKEVPIKLVFKRFPWKRIYSEIEWGNVSASVFPIYLKEKYLEFILLNLMVLSI